MKWLLLNCPAYAQLAWWWPNHIDHLWNTCGSFFWHWWIGHHHIARPMVWWKNASSLQAAGHFSKSSTVFTWKLRNHALWLANDTLITCQGIWMAIFINAHSMIAEAVLDAAKNAIAYSIGLYNWALSTSSQTYNEAEVNNLALTLVSWQEKNVEHAAEFVHR